MSSSSDSDTWVPEVDDPNDHELAVDPDDPRVDELYVGPGSSSHRRYHMDSGCPRLQGSSNPRRAEIAADWYPPCRCCVTREFPPYDDHE